MQKVCNSEDGGLNDALKLARRVENDGVVASAALELSGTPPQLPGTATTVSTGSLQITTAGASGGCCLSAWSRELCAGPGLYGEAAAVCDADRGTGDVSPHSRLIRKFTVLPRILQKISRLRRL